MEAEVPASPVSLCDLCVLRGSNLFLVAARLHWARCQLSMAEVIQLFEFHGWATIRVDDRDEPDMEVLRGREDAAIVRLRDAMKPADDDFSLFDLRRTSNQLLVLFAHGLRNHRYEPVIELFHWVAAELPFSYGLLYVHDDEDTRRGFNYDNEFRVWRLAMGTFAELADPYLSPYTPTVEPPWEWPPGPPDEVAK